MIWPVQLRLNLSRFNVEPSWGTSTMNQGGEVLGRCFELAGAGRLDEAGDLAEQALGRDEDDGSLWRFVGLLRHQAGDFRGARDALETAQALVPFDPEASCALAESLARTGRVGPALEIYDALAADRRCPEGLMPAIAAGLGYLGEDRRALDVCVELIRRRPDHAEAHFGAAFYLRRLGRPPETAMSFVARAHELAPKEVLYRVSLAALLDHAGRRDEACDLLRGVDLDGVSCRCCLRRMNTIFLAVEAPSRRGVCGDRPGGEPC
jgi:tetratricopeptide (TPR) repeat protein